MRLRSAKGKAFSYVSRPSKTTKSGSKFHPKKSLNVSKSLHCPETSKVNRVSQREAYGRQLSKFYRADKRKFVFCGLKYAPYLDEIGRCFQQLQPVGVYIEDMPYVQMEKVLTQLKLYDGLEEVELDVWGIEWDPKLLRLLLTMLRSSSAKLKHVAIRGRLLPESLKSTIDTLEKNVKVLDLSNNVIGDNCSIVASLIRLIRYSQLNELKLCGCEASARFRDEFCNGLSQLGVEMPLCKLEGIDFYGSPDLPMPVQLSLYNEKRTHSSLTSSNKPLLEYLKNKCFASLLLKKRIRVWWPPTSDERKTDFAGRFWPAQVIHVDPVHLIFVIKYDNGEVENVSQKFLQPLSPFQYGNTIVNESATDENNLKAGNLSNVHKGREKSAKKANRVTAYKEIGKFEKESAAEEGCENILWEGEICEFRDPEESLGLDPSDFVGLVVSLNVEEPTYEVRYIYHDEESLVAVSTDDIRRCVTVTWENWRDWTLGREYCLQHSESDVRVSTVPPYDYLSPIPGYTLTPKKMRNPMDMPHRSEKEFEVFLAQHKHRTHPQVKLAQEVKRMEALSAKSLINELRRLRSECLSLKLKATKNRLIEEECQRMREQLDEKKNAIAELENELNCMICSSKRTNCVIKPCLHFNCCDQCVALLKNCPSCRRWITGSLKLLLKGKTV